MVSVVHSKSELEQVLTHDGLVVVEFFAVWCGPCKMIAPLLDKFSKEYTQAKFVKVDVDELSDVAAQYEISAMPTTLFFKGNKQVAKVIGADAGKIKQAISEHA